MTTAYEQALEALLNFPATATEEERAEAGRRVTELAAAKVYVMSREEAASFAEARAQAKRGEFASEEEVQALWAKHGL
jgi:hypothetical protein